MEIHPRNYAIFAETLAASRQRKAHREPAAPDRESPVCDLADRAQRWLGFADDGASAPEPVANWNGQVRFVPGAVAEPRTIDELQRVISESERVRLIGSAHSMNASLAADPGTTLVRTSHLNRMAAPVAHADGTFTVWVEAGAKIKDISAHLAKHGLAFEALPTSEKITIGGAIANGVHGSGSKTRTVLAEQVVGLQVVDQHGVLQTVDAADLPIARIGLGSLGATARVQLRVVPNFELMNRDDRIPRAGVFDLENLQAMLAQHEYLELFFRPGEKDVTRWTMDRVTAENRHLLGDAERKDRYDNTPELVQSAISVLELIAIRAPETTKLPALYRYLNDKVAFDPRPTRFGEARFMFHEDLSQPLRDTSFGVPLERAAEAAARLEAAFARLNYTPQYPIGVRFLGASSDTELGMNSGRAVAVFEMPASMQDGDGSVSEAVRAFERILRDLGGRPHWGKEFSLNPRAAYPEASWEKFRQLSNRLAGDKFVNAWADAMTPAAG